MVDCVEVFVLEGLCDCLVVGCDCVLVVCVELL